MLIRNLIMPHNDTTMTVPDLVEALQLPTTSGQVVTAERSRNVATAYRCINILSDDIAKMPFQMFVSRTTGQIQRVMPNSMMQNMAWLMEVRPNRYMTPFIFKKALAMWLITQGNAYAWLPPRRSGRQRELFILPSNGVQALYDTAGDLWYQVTFSNGQTEYLPDVEIFRLAINSTNGIDGTAVITYARETLGRQIGAHETQGKFYSQGLNPGGVIWLAGDASEEARNKVRDAYARAMSGSENAYRLAVMDNKVTRFESITMKPVDAQFLESIRENDLDIANFFGMPLFKLNMGKQAYNSNEQANLDYLQTTLDPYLVQWEQEAALRWLTEDEQNYAYFRFNRDAILRTDAKTRGEYLTGMITSGQMTPNEARAINDMPAYQGGDSHYIPANMSVIGGDNA